MSRVEVRESVSSVVTFHWPAKSAEWLEQIEFVGARLIGERHASAEELNDRLDRNCRFLSVAESKGELRAYGLIYMLTAHGTERILAGTARSPSDLEIHEYATGGANSRSLYVGMIGSAARPSLTAPRLLAWHLACLSDLARGAERVFARPATASGHRLIDRLGMAPLHTDSDLYSVSMGCLAPVLHNLPTAAPPTMAEIANLSRLLRRIHRIGPTR